jgi:hypothetical protein
MSNGKALSFLLSTFGEEGRDQVKAHYDLNDSTEISLLTVRRQFKQLEVPKAELGSIFDGPQEEAKIDYIVIDFDLWFWPGIGYVMIGYDKDSETLYVQNNKSGLFDW